MVLFFYATDSVKYLKLQECIINVILLQVSHEPILHGFDTICGILYISSYICLCYIESLHVMPCPLD